MAENGTTDAPVVVRLAELADLDAMVEVHTLARSAYYQAGGLTEAEYDTPDGREFRRKSWSEVITSTDRRAICAVRDGTVVGVAAMGPPYAEPVEPGVGQLYQIHVRPDSWGQGIGSQLLVAFVDYLRENSLTTGRLEAWDQNARGQAFYARHGWRPDGYSQPGARDTTYVQLRLDLDSLPG